MKWSQHLANTWFTDGSSTTNGTKTNRKAAACRLGDGMAITEEGTTKSAQHTEVVTALLAIRQLRKAKGKSISSPVHSVCAMVQLYAGKT